MSEIKLPIMARIRRYYDGMYFIMIMRLPFIIERIIGDDLSIFLREDHT